MGSRKWALELSKIHRDTTDDRMPQCSLTFNDFFFLQQALSWPDIFFIRVWFPCHSAHSFSIRVEKAHKQLMAVLSGVWRHHTKTSPLQTVPICLQNDRQCLDITFQGKGWFREYIAMIFFPQCFISKNFQSTENSRISIINTHMPPPRFNKY